MKYLILILLIGCGANLTEESWQEHSQKYEDFNLKVEVKPADTYGYYMVHIIADNERYPYGEGIHRDRNKAIAWALRDLAEEIEKQTGDTNGRNGN